MVRFLRLLSAIAWWQLAVLFTAIVIGCCSNWFESMPEWRRLRRGEVAQAQGASGRASARLAQPNGPLTSGPTIGAVRQTTSIGYDGHAS
jgi:hypothetical protein